MLNKVQNGLKQALQNTLGVRKLAQHLDFMEFNEVPWT
jgi:hypothetical protein